MQGCLCTGEAQFHQLVELIKYRHTAIYFYAVSKVMGKRKGQCDNMLFFFKKTTVHVDVPLLKPIQGLSSADEAPGFPA